MTFFKNIFRNWSTGKPNFSLTLTISNILLKFESKFCLIFFDNEIWKKFLNYCFCFCVRTVKTMCRSMLNWFIFLKRNIAIKSFFKKLNWSNVGHSNTDFQFILRRFCSFVFPSTFGFCNRDTSLTVKKTRKIFNRWFHNIISFCRYYIIDNQQNQVEFLNKQANSVELPMPKGNGQYRAKLREISGVCNEYGLAPKGMMYSDLYGNIESATEMIAPVF